MDINRALVSGLSPAEAEEFFAKGEDARLYGLTGPSNSPDSLGALAQGQNASTGSPVRSGRALLSGPARQAGSGVSRAQLYVELMAAAKSLAVRGVAARYAGSADGGVMVYVCRECTSTVVGPMPLEHRDGCRIGRVLELLDRLALDACKDAIAPGESYGEPWELEAKDGEFLLDAAGNSVWWAAGTGIAPDDWPDMARRIAACVNFCRTLSVENLERGPLVDRLTESIFSFAGQKGGAQ